MTDGPQHYCSACGEIHGGAGGKSPEVRIAEINAQRDVEIAKLEYREAQEAAVIGAETAAVVTELETAAEVAVAEETDPVPPEPEPDPTPVTIVDADADADGGDPSIVPADEQGDTSEPVSSGSSSSNPWW